MIALPTLSPAGWIKNPLDKLDFLLSYYYTSDKHRSLIYGDNITNLQWTVENTVHDYAKMTIQVNGDLLQLLSRYFDAVDVNVSNDALLKQLSDADDSVVTISVAISIVDNGNTYDASHTIELRNGKFSKVIRKINDGV